MKRLFWFIFLFLIGISTPFFCLSISDGKSFLKERDYEQARQAFYLFYSNNSTHKNAPEALFEYCKLQIHSKDILRDLKVLITKYPDYPKMDEVLDTLGKIYFQSYQFDACIDTYYDLGKRYPSSPLRDQAYYYLGKSYYNIKDYEASRYYFKLLIKMWPKDDRVPFWMLEIGLTHFAENSKSSLQEAVEYFKKVVLDYRYASCRPQALFHLGICYLQLHNTKEADKWLKSVIQEFPKSMEATFAQKKIAQSLKVHSSPNTDNEKTVHHVKTSNPSTLTQNSGRAGSTWYIQAGIFRSEESAKVLQRTIQRLGLPANQRKFSTNKNLIQVYIGYFSSQTDAEKSAQLLGTHQIAFTIKQDDLPTVSKNAEPIDALQGKGSIYIQLGMYSVAQFAKDLEKKAESLGFPAQVRTYKASSKTYYQVYLGFYSERNQAETIIDQLSHKQIDAYIRTEEK